MWDLQELSQVQELWEQRELEELWEQQELWEQRELGEVLYDIWPTQKYARSIFHLK